MTKILYIGLDYYHYPKVICQAFQGLGHEVDFYPIEPKTMFYMVSRYIAKAIYRRAIDKYHSEIIEKSKSTKYEKIFFVTAHFFSMGNLEKLRSTHSEAEFVAYHWDSVAQYNFLDSVAYFDKIFSFDREDCLTYGFIYQPLFASSVYQEKGAKNSEHHDIDVYTVGTVVQPARYILVDRFRQYCVQNNIAFCFYLKVTPITYLRLLFNGVFPKGVSFGSMKPDQLKAVACRSTAVLDVTNNRQSGMTMRTIENIYSGKKLITTNQNIAGESFYDNDQVYILDGDNYCGVKEFLKKNYEVKKYPELSIDSWAKKVLSK